MDIARMLSWTADRYPSQKAVGGVQPLTYRQWHARTSQLARALASLGVRSGDRVAFLLAGGEPMASLHLAVQKLGAASVPLSVRFGPAELGYCVGDADPMLVIGDETTQASLAAALGGPAQDRAALDVIARREPDGELGVRTLLASILAAGTWVPQARFDADRSLELIARDRVSALYLVPTMYWSLLRTGRLAEARSRCPWPARRRSPAIATARTPTPGPSATAGTLPATWPPRTTTAICGSAAGSTT